MKLYTDIDEITDEIIGSSFDVMNELGVGFLENVYRNSLANVLIEKGLSVCQETPLDVFFRGKRVGFYKADLIVNDKVIVELKCCKELQPEHSAQVINYLAATGLSVALLLNFGKKKIEFKRLFHE